MGQLENSQYGFSSILEGDNFTANVYIDNHNKRIKLLDYAGEVDIMHDRLLHLCKKYDLGKIISTISEDNIEPLIDRGYIAEGIINGFFKGAPGYCLSFFTDLNRSVSKNTENEDSIIKKTKEVKELYVPGGEGFGIRTATKKDIDSLCLLFDEVFKTYPTPMNDPAYVEKVMNEQVLFKVAYVGGKLVSAASADMDKQNLNAEITDCATYPEYRGKGLLSELVYHLEQELKVNGFITLFSLSRALSTGINIVLSKHGYEYTGRLVNNCNIMGNFEDMNIWVKSIV